MIQSLVRKNILAMNAYSSARSEYSGSSNVFLDANENPFGVLNRYPDPQQRSLKEVLACKLQIDAENICIGNGSDEIIDLAIRIFCEPKKDKILIFTPTYGMYQVCAATNDVEIIKLALTENFQIDKEAYLNTICDPDIKMVFICSPNNPTANDIDDIPFVLDTFKGMVFVDEAYIEFSDRPSCVQYINKYQNLIVCRTLSKAYGLAGLRIGYANSTRTIIDFFNKVKPPYNISKLNQEAAAEGLNTANEKELVAFIKAQKEYINQELSQFQFVKKIYPSSANFILLVVDSATNLYQYLLSKDIVVRNRENDVRNAVRITIGTLEENRILIEAFINYSSQKK